MTGSLLASRYARALFDLAVEHDLLDRVQEELLEGAELTESAEFSSIFFHPKVEKQAKKNLIIRVFAPYHPFVQNFFQMVVDKGRERALTGIAREFLHLARVHRGEVTAQVTTAVALNEGELATLKAKLGRSAKKVIIEETIDQAIMGGIVIRVGNKIYDGSLAQRMKRLHRQLTQAK